MKSLSHVPLFETPWTAAYQVPPSMGFSRREYWSGLPFTAMYKIDNKVLMYSTGDSNQHSIIPLWGKNLKKNEYMYN